MTHRKDNDYLNGVPELLVLRLLARQPMHGYELVQSIRLCTGGVLAFGEGCVYPVLHRLEAEQAVASRREDVNGRSRVVYRLTPDGQRRLAAATARWEQVATAIRDVLKEGSDASPTLA
jgi:PadR family transcriptional regulator PadR